MSTTITTEHKPLAVAASSGRVRGEHAVAAMPASCMTLAFADFQTTYRRPELAAFGTWNPARRLVGFVT